MVIMILLSLIALWVLNIIISALVLGAIGPTYPTTYAWYQSAPVEFKRWGVVHQLWPVFSYLARRERISHASE